MKYIILILLISVCSLNAAEPAPVSLSKITKKLPKITVKNWSPKLHQQLVQVLVANHEWAALNTALEDWLLANYSHSIVAGDGWQAMAGLQQWCYLFAKNPRIYTSLKPETVAWLLSDRLLTETLFSTLKPQDNKQEVLELLQKFHQKYPKTFPKYNRLAVAVAVVWDNPSLFSSYFEKSKEPTCTPSERYVFWVNTQESGLADYNLAELEPKFSKFIVDAFCTLKELRRAQKENHLTRNGLEKACDSIEYANDNRKDNYGIILHGKDNAKKNGHRVPQQFYFNLMSGKANGIPTLIFSGYDKFGNFKNNFMIWIGYLDQKNSWNLICPKYPPQKYVQKYTIDSQTGLKLFHYNLTFTTEDFNHNPEFKNSEARLKYIRILVRRDKKTEALKTIEKSVESTPKHLASWILKTEILASLKDSYPMLKKHLENMQIKFRNCAEIKLKVQLKLIDLARANNDLITLKNVEKDAIRDAKKDRPDLSVVLYERKINSAISREDWKEARSISRAGFNDFKKELDILYYLTDFFIKECIKNDGFAEARSALLYFKTKDNGSPFMKYKIEYLENELKKHN